MFVAYTAKIRGIIECWQYYGVCEDYNGVVSKVLGDGWLNPQILSVQSLEAHHRSGSFKQRMHSEGAFHSLDHPRPEGSTAIEWLCDIFFHPFPPPPFHLLCSHLSRSPILMC